MTVWRLRPGDDPGTWPLWRADKLVSVPSDGVGDLTTWPGDAGLRAALARSPAHRARSAQARASLERALRAFRTEMRPGDLVVVPTPDGTAAVARVAGTYRYHPTAGGPHLRHVRPVQWVRTEVARDTLGDAVRRSLRAPGPLVPVPGADPAALLRPPTGA